MVMVTKGWTDDGQGIGGNGDPPPPRVKVGRGRGPPPWCDMMVSPSLLFLFFLKLLILIAFVLHCFVVECVNLGVCGISPDEVLPEREV